MAASDNKDKKKPAPKKAGIDRQIIGFTKARKILFFTIKPRPIYSSVTTAQEAQVQQQAAAATLAARSGPKVAPATKMKKDLTAAMADLGIKMTPEQYLAKSKKKAAVIAVVATIGSGAAIYLFLQQLLILVPLVGIMVYLMVYNAFATMPMSKTKSRGKEVEKDMLFAARDMIVSMRSGLPLFNAMLTVSSGYGAASVEFKKIIDRVQLGEPIEQAIEEVSEKSESTTFKRIMLQASASLKVGADVVATIQEVINDVSAERVIELRRYGQRLNAIAMFYMLFGIIFPSMGLAVASIMSTFIAVFPVDDNTLIMAAFGIVFLQFVFLKMVTSARPAFST